MRPNIGSDAAQRSILGRSRRNSVESLENHVARATGHFRYHSVDDPFDEWPIEEGRSSTAGDSFVSFSEVKKENVSVASNEKFFFLA